MSDVAVLIEKIENKLIQTLPECTGELANVPEMLAYSLAGGGKRIRPLLCLEFCKAVGGNPDRALLSACAVEYVHTYSLIHDDLPAMDNDSMRRGRPASHIRFGEANAILTGDALLTHAFYLLAKACEDGDISAENAVKSVRELSRLAGVNGMVGGQYIDLAYENKRADIDVLFNMDALKTAALIESACVLGLLAGNASPRQIDSARDFALYLGLAFQITDDLLEIGEDGVSADEKNAKSTYITELGIEKAKEYARQYTQKAIQALNAFGESADEIRMLAQDLLSRKK